MTSPSMCNVFLIPISWLIGIIIKFPNNPPRFNIETTIVGCSPVNCPVGYVLFALLSSNKLMDVQKFENPYEYDMILPKMGLHKMIKFLQKDFRNKNLFSEETYNIKQLKTVSQQVEYCTFL